MRDKEFSDSGYSSENDLDSPEFDCPWKSGDMPKYECQGIGHGATCGQEATIPVQCFKWSPDAERVQEVTVWICYKHSVQLTVAKNNT